MAYTVSGFWGSELQLLQKVFACFFLKKLFESTGQPLATSSTCHKDVPRNGSTSTSDRGISLIFLSWGFNISYAGCFSGPLNLPFAYFHCSRISPGTQSFSYSGHRTRLWHKPSKVASFFWHLSFSHLKVGPMGMISCLVVLKMPSTKKIMCKMEGLGEWFENTSAIRLPVAEGDNKLPPCWALNDVPSFSLACPLTPQATQAHLKFYSITRTPVGATAPICLRILLFQLYAVWSYNAVLGWPVLRPNTCSGILSMFRQFKIAPNWPYTFIKPLTCWHD